MARKVAALLLWLVVLAGAASTIFFVAMLLTPGYGGAVIGVAAGLSALITAGAAVALRRRSRRRRAAAAATRHPVGGRELELLRPGRRRWTLVGLIGAAFVALAVWLQVRNSINVGLLLAGVFFGVCLLVAVIQLKPGSSWLRITTEGLVVRNLGRVRTYRWEDIDGFRAYAVSTLYTYQRFVGWDACDDAAPGVQRSRLSRRLAGVDDGLPDTYGEDADELAERLQRYRREYAGQSRHRDESSGRIDVPTA